MKPLWERQLEEDLDWRMAELAVLKLQVRRHSKGDLPYTSLIRALWAMLYAHYEGFCIFAFNVYLEQIEKEGPKRSACKQPIVLLSLEEDIRRFRGDMSSEKCFHYFSVEMGRLLNEKMVFERDPKTNEFKIKGRSNLYPANLIEQCVDTCLNVPAVDAHKDELRALVGRRNEIAHGRKLIIDDFVKYPPYEDAAVAVMHELAYEIIKSINEKQFIEPIPEYHV